MAVRESVLVIASDGAATELPWPVEDAARQWAIAAAVDSDRTRMRRCGKGILGFYGEDGQGKGKPPNLFAAAAFTEQGIELDSPVFGAVLFARNPSKGSAVKSLTAAQAANLLVVTGARLT